MGWRNERAAVDWIDVVVAALATAFTLAMLAQGGLGATESDTRPLDLSGALLAILTTAPLLLRRRTPALTYAVTAVASLVLLALRYPLDVPPGPMIAAYTLADAVGGDTARRRRLLAAASVAVFVPLAILITLVREVPTATLVSGMSAWTAMFAFVWIAGDRNRLRRERIVELEERGRRREREVAAQRRLAAAQERTRIARELHDSAGHAINVILMQAGAARLLHERDPARSRKAIETVEEVARGTIVEIDRLVRALREDERLQMPTPTDTVALEELIDRHAAGGLRVTVGYRGSPRALPSGVAWAAYRILQEALTNAARHGRGSADVTLSYLAEAVEITVRNPVARRPAGDGPRGGPDRPGGLGIVGMRERASLLGGTLHVGTVPGDGTPDDTFHLYARLPFAPDTDGDAGVGGGAGVPDPAVRAGAAPVGGPR